MKIIGEWLEKNLRKGTVGDIVAQNFSFIIESSNDPTFFAAKTWNP
jgi:hypothetical protein